MYNKLKVKKKGLTVSCVSGCMIDKSAKLNPFEMKKQTKVPKIGTNTFYASIICQNKILSATAFVKINSKLVT